MGQEVDYATDLAIVMDATASMGSVISDAKDLALNFAKVFTTKMEEVGKPLEALRVRMVVYRDIYVDGNDAFEVSPFYELPKESKKLESFVKKIKAKGGGDEPENGLEALSMAMNSEWTEVGSKRRHVILVLTDASTHPLQKHPEHKNYPKGMPLNFDELTDQWESQDMDPNAKRLALFCPDASHWTDITEHWENTVYFPSRAGSGLSEFELDEVLASLAGSI